MLSKINTISSALLLSAWGASAVMAEGHNESVDFGSMSCVALEMQAMANERSYDSEVETTIGRRDFTTTVHSDRGMFTGTLFDENPLRESFSISVNHDGSYTLRSNANYHEKPISTDFTITADKDTMFIGGNGDRYIMEQHMHDFRRLQRIAGKCIDSDAHIHAFHR